MILQPPDGTDRTGLSDDRLVSEWLCLMRKIGADKFNNLVVRTNALFAKEVETGSVLIRVIHTVDTKSAKITFEVPFRLISYRPVVEENLKRWAEFSGALSSVNGILKYECQVGQQREWHPEYYIEEINASFSRFIVRLEHGLSEAQRYNEIPEAICKIISDSSGFRGRV